MSFSKEWDARYGENAHLSIWPWTDLVSFFHRYAKPFDQNTKVLEIGFGAGANIPFFRSLGVDYMGVEGSSIICSKVGDAFPDLRTRLFVGDFTSYPLDQMFDVIVDRSSMTCNSTVAIERGLEHLSRHLVKGGKYIGIDWFSTDHSDYSQGEVVDEFTRRNIQQGQFVGVGNVHFSSKAHLIEIFSRAGMAITRLEHKIHKTEIPKEGHVFAAWNLVAEKK